jgi:hypothetical protein
MAAYSSVASDFFGAADHPASFSLPPARAAFYDTLGLQTVCPTSRSIDIMTEAICATPGRMPGDG